MEISIPVHFSEEKYFTLINKRHWIAWEECEMIVKKG
jgi:hypothetical protein